MNKRYHFFVNSATFAAIPCSFAAEFLERLLYCARTYFILFKIYFALSFFPPAPNAGLFVLLLLLVGIFLFEEECKGGFVFEGVLLELFRLFVLIF